MPSPKDDELIINESVLTTATATKRIFVKNYTGIWLLGITSSGASDMTLAVRPWYLSAATTYSQHPRDLASEGSKEQPRISLDVTGMHSIDVIATNGNAATKTLKVSLHAQ